MILISLWSWQEALAPLIENPETNRIIILNGTTIKAQSIQYRKPLKYAALLDCLIYYESQICQTQKKERCIGDHGTSFGILQFKRATFKQFCINKYGLAQNLSQIFDAEIQKKCANYMLEENWNNIYHWRNTIKKCLK